jgi:hypothetical protein
MPYKTLYNLKNSKNKISKMRFTICLIWLLPFLSCFQKKESSQTLAEQAVRYKKQVNNIAYYFPSSLDSNQRKKLIDKCEMSIHDNLKLIDETSFTDSIDIEFLDSRKEMLKYTGMAASGMAFPERKTMFSLANLKEAPIKHELQYLITMLKWGEPHQTSIWMNEGLATFSENKCNNYNVEQIYCYLISKHMQIRIDSLTGNFYGQSEMIAYHQSAFFVQFMLDKYGIAKFKELWKNGFDRFQYIYGIPFSQIQLLINETAKNHYPKTPNINWDEFKKGCI